MRTFEQAAFAATLWSVMVKSESDRIATLREILGPAMAANDGPAATALDERPRWDAKSYPLVNSVEAMKSH